MGGPPICHAFTMPWWGRVLEFPPYFTWQAINKSKRNPYVLVSSRADKRRTSSERKQKEDSSAPPTNPKYIMSNKTGRMSADEKRRAVLGIYHRTKMVYTEKEIIALAAKAGVNQNT